MTTEIHESGCMDDNVDYSEKAENHGIVHRQHSAKDVRDRFRSRSNSDIELNTYHKDDRNHDEQSLSHSMDLPPSVRGLSWTSLKDYVQSPLPGEKRIDERCKVEFNLGDTSQNIVEGELTYPKLEELEDLSKEGFNISESFSFHDICHQTIKAKKDRYHNLKGCGTGSSGSSSGYSTGSSYGSESSGTPTSAMILIDLIKRRRAEQARIQRTFMGEDSDDGSDENNSDRQLPVVGSVDSLRSISPIHHHGNSERHLQVSSAGSGSRAYLFDFGQSLFVERKDMQTVIDKYKDLMPPELQVEYYDVMILYSYEDREAADEYKRHLTEDIVLEKGLRIKAVLYDDLEMVSLGVSRFKDFENSFQRCIFTFIFLTKAFCECEWWAFSTEGCLMEAIYDPLKKWCVVPVYTVQSNKVDFKIPIGLNSLKGVNYYSNDQFYQRGLKRLIGDKIHIRMNHERKQIKEQYRWACEQRDNQEILKSKSKPPN